METYAKIVLIATPFFLGFVMLEKLYAYFKYGHKIRLFDTISSLSSGSTNSLKDVLGLSISIISYPWLLKYFSFFSIENHIITYLVAFVALDFSGYWVHRLSHSINLFWNKHTIHHSSEEFDLACALRQSISTFINLFTFFLLPAAFFGVPKQVIAIVAPLHLFAQFWYHTVYINKMGFLEHIIVTPSHHRVHHALNKEYLDKNLGQIFIFWDKLFGTFQEELATVPPVYGISRPARTWNPIKINFQHLALLISDAYRTPSWKEKLSIWFKPTGWRPEGFEEKYPVLKIENPHKYIKFETSLNTTKKAYVLVQFILMLSYLSLFYYNLALFSYLEMLTIGLFIFLQVYVFSMLMDSDKNWIYAEIFKNILGIILALFIIKPHFEFEVSTVFMVLFLIQEITALILHRRA
jgi:alkylglycerol monooxygenase